MSVETNLATLRQFIFDNFYLPLGDENPEESDIFLFGEQHRDMEFRRKYCKFIDLYREVFPNERVVVLIEGVPSMQAFQPSDATRFCTLDEFWRETTHQAKTLCPADDDEKQCYTPLEYLQNKILTLGWDDQMPCVQGHYLWSQAMERYFELKDLLFDMCKKDQFNDKEKVARLSMLMNAVYQLFNQYNKESDRSVFLRDHTLVKTVRKTSKLFTKVFVIAGRDHFDISRKTPLAKLIMDETSEDPLSQKKMTIIFNNKVNKFISPLAKLFSQHVEEFSPYWKRTGS